MEEQIRISPKDAKKKIASGTAKFVCAYEDEEKCNNLGLEGSISFTKFKAELKPTLSKDAEIIFYCA
jgi:hypothetical protein